VVGAAGTGKSTLVNLLLDSPAGQAYSPVGGEARRGSRTRHVYRFRYGSTAAADADRADAALVDVRVPAPWLERLEASGGLELWDTPGPGSGAVQPAAAAVERAIEGADQVLLVTDSVRQLSDAGEAALLRRLADRRPIVVVNHAYRLSASAAAVVADVQRGVDAVLLPRADDGLVLGERVPVFAVSALQYACGVPLHGQSARGAVGPPSCMCVCACRQGDRGTGGAGRHGVARSAAGAVAGVRGR
jgi:rhodanese-related sulfurtransferase